MDIAISVNNVPIRLTRERWRHIIEEHNDLAGYYDEILDIIEQPDLIIRGYGGALIAIRGISRNRYLAVIYKEISSNDGFVITAYFTSKIDRRKIIWQNN
ncbi:hypothetical protein FJZ31_27050 [Candidatus Poribacteria bacterium]|nr:hypothetical protein [Candidatus Poribacteria bacterium]